MERGDQATLGARNLESVSGRQSWDWSRFGRALPRFGQPKTRSVIGGEVQGEGKRVIAVGTSVVRAIESAWDGEKVRPSAGFTSLYIHPDNGVNVVDGLLTGFHDPVTSHLAMLYAIAGQELIREAYIEAVSERYRWHEFGDSHLIFSANPSHLPDLRRPAAFTGGISATTI